MFITRKQLNEKIAEAVNREREKQDAWGYMRRVKDDLCRNMQWLDERISRLEHSVKQEEECKAVKPRE